jgi:hypothetical protein
MAMVCAAKVAVAVAGWLVIVAHLSRFSLCGLRGSTRHCETSTKRRSSSWWTAATVSERGEQQERLQLQLQLQLLLGNCSCLWKLDGQLQLRRQLQMQMQMQRQQ